MDKATNSGRVFCNMAIVFDIVFVIVLFSREQLIYLAEEPGKEYYLLLLFY